MSTSLSNYEIAYVRQLMVLSVLRGWMGSGAFAVSSHHKKMRIEMFKTEFCGAELACDPSFDKIVSQNPKIITAHCRAPTRGENTLDFIHPHRVKALTGVHNGTMNTVMGNVLDSKVSDSRAIYEAIAEHGVEEFVKNSRGAYSLVWTDAEKGTLNFLRNSERPMVFARVGNGDFASTMYFASEKGMLEYVLSGRGNISPNVITYMSPKPYQHLIFPLSIRQGCKPVEVKEYEEPFKVTSYSGWSRAEYEAAWEEFEKNDDDKGTSVVPLRLEDKTTSTTTSTTSGSTSTTGYRGIDRDKLRALPRVDTIVGKRGPEKGSNFPERSQTTELSVPALIGRSGCVICDERPKLGGMAQVVGGDPVQEYPKIHIVRFGHTGFAQYICDDCVNSKNHLALTVLGSQIAASTAIN